MSAHSVLGTADKLLPAHEVLQIPLPLWLRHRDADENSDIKQYPFFIQLYCWKLCPSTAASQSKCYPSNCSTFQCFSYNLLHRRLNSINFISTGDYSSWNFFLYFFFLEKLCCWVFPSLTFIREESRLKADAFVDVPSVTANWLHGSLQCSELLPPPHWQPEVLEKRNDAQKVDKTELTAKATLDI